MNYKGVEIKLQESSSFVQKTSDGMQEYTVSCENGLAFSAHSKFGTSYAREPGDALNLAQEQIDQGLAW